MSQHLFLSTANLTALAADLLASGVTVIGPAKASDGRTDYRTITAPDDLVPGNGMPRRSLKEVVLPPTEPLLAWQRKGPDVTLDPVPTAFAPRVVLGARPCDAAGLEVLDRVMGWDYRDELYFGRREATTVVALACTAPDAACFCSAMGLAPDSSRGADILLVPTAGGFLVEVVTDKGRALLDGHPSRITPAPDDAVPDPAVAHAREQVAGAVAATPEAVRAWLGTHFDDPLWEELALRCNGCGACAAVCPTCHCFDIVDEPSSPTHGVRRRNWDTCQTARFTVHASGHNPRAGQPSRCRQRVMHKLSIYPEKFGVVACVGCGRCVRACPAGQCLPETLERIVQAAAAAGAVGRVEP